MNSLLLQIIGEWGRMGGNFEADLNALLPNPTAEIHVSPRAIVLAYPVRSGASLVELHRYGTPQAEPDAWFILAAMGDPAAMFAWMPFELPLVGFERFDDRPRFFPTRRLRRTLTRLSHGTQKLRSSSPAPTAAHASP